MGKDKPFEITWPQSVEPWEPEFFTYHSSVGCGGMCKWDIPHVHVMTQSAIGVLGTTYSLEDWINILDVERSNSHMTPIPRAFQALEVNSA